MNNIPAFPRPKFMEQAVRYDQEDGMTLRDYFAAMALQGMNARDTYDAGQASPYQRAKLAYLEADAMMKAREQ